MRKSTGILLAIACFFAGSFLGCILAPAKQGFGNTRNYYLNKKDEKKETESI